MGIDAHLRPGRRRRRRAHARSAATGADGAPPAPIWALEPMPIAADSTDDVHMLQLSTRPVPRSAQADQDHRVIGVAYVDTSEGHEALRAAHGLARRTGALLRVITVVKSTIGMYPDIHAESAAAGGTDLQDIETEQQQLPEPELRALIDGLGGDVAVELETFIGDPGDTLVAISENLDLLVCGSRGYGPLRSSVSCRVTAEARCPVMVLPPGVTGALDRFVETS
jgi:nucleotide-binding universal stress UspA family protein